jgi:hypothetical protein
MEVVGYRYVLDMQTELKPIANRLRIKSDRL